MKPNPMLKMNNVGTGNDLLLSFKT